MIKTLVLTILTLLSIESYSDQTETFIINFGSEKVSVIPAKKSRSKYAVIINNFTTGPLIGEIASESKNIRIPVSIPKEKGSGKKGVRTFEVPWRKGEKFYFFPFSPPFERVELIVGGGRYEIPPKK
ncbi:MAG: hypothetical protein ACPGJV_04990 [Bacteriovoracaceae bacterium]